MKFLIGFCFCMSILWLAPNAEATHISGGDIEWEYLGNDSFLITLNIYRNCNGKALANQPLTIGSSTCGKKNFPTTLSALGDVTPVCDEQCTRCDSRGCTFKYGIQKWALSAIVDVSDFKKNNCCWLTVSFNECCRDNQFTTGAYGTTFYLESKFNICDATPLAIHWQSAPVSVICLGRDHVNSSNMLLSSYVGDSIVHTLTEPLKNDSQKTPWTSPYSYDNPIYYLGFPVASKALPQGFWLDPTTSTLRFRPMKEEQTLITIKAQVYRNGQLLGETMREQPIVVIKCPSNSPPIISGMNCISNRDEDFTAAICQGEKLEFDVCVSDQDQDDTVSITYNHNIPNAKISIINKGSKRESLHFEWKADTTDTFNRAYSLVVEATDDACPVNGRRSRVFLIHVNKNQKITIDTIPQSCGNYLFIAKGDSFEHFEWTLNTNTIVHTKKGKTNIDSLKYRFKQPGTHTLKAKAYTNGRCSHLSTSTLQVANNFMWTKPTRPDTLRPCSGQTFKVGVKTFGTSTTPTTTWNQIDSSKGFQSSRNFKAGSRNNWINYRVSDGNCTLTDSFFIRTQLEYVRLPKILTGCEGTDTLTLEPFSHPSHAHDSVVSFVWQPSTHRDSTLKVTQNSTVYLEMKDTNGCLYKDTSILRFKNGQFTIPNDTLLCEPGNALFNASTSSKGTFDWFFKGNKTKFIDSVNVNTYVDRAQPVIITFTDTLDSKNCSYKDSFQLGFRYPAFSQLSYPDSLCTGDSFDLKTRLPQAKWTFQDSSRFGSTAKLWAQSSQPGRRNYRLQMEGISQYGCTKDTQVLIFVHQAPNVRFTAPDSVFQNWKINPQNLSTNSKSYRYDWEVGIPPFIFSNDYNPTLRIDSIGIFDLKLRVTHKWNGCSDSSLRNIKVLQRVSQTLPNKLNQVKLFPNPAKEQIHLQWPEAGDYSIRIYSTSGQLLKEYHGDDKQVDIEVMSLREGFYLIQVQNATNSVVYTFEIAR